MVCRKTFIPNKELKKFCSAECRELRKKEKVKKAVQRFRKNEGAKKTNQTQKRVDKKFNDIEQAIEQVATVSDDLLSEILEWRLKNLESEETYKYVGETFIQGIEIHDPEFETKIKEFIENEL